ncbi:GGDEF domain-containing protein [Neptuniibacter caesariensis]|uniref:diguanylate cyclase n=1 Tax=Neptuniibacter caesariensis TaxID=207954 RepID=A0A7U8GQM5_NEPCE|nr:GGDEF domain-containing protein [Neptuniibacter caesariensis]EAR60477.1 diguanylate cyclase/phosphodiesterase (GGDEF & EAL domains) with PAS/PAC sensor [Oceanospirillum sp. MED92] [Neptuniibacter caesariensis]
MTNSEQHKKNNTRVFLLATAIALLILVNGGFAYWQMNQVKAEFYEVANRDLPLAQELLPLIDRQFEQTLLIEKLHQLKPEHRIKVVPILEESFIRTGNKFAETSAKLETMLKPMLDSPREMTRTKMQSVDQLLKQIIKEHHQYQTQVLEMIDHNKESRLEYPTELLDLLADEEKDLTNELISLRDELQRFTLNSAKAVERHEAMIIKGVVIFTLFAFSLGTIMLILIRQIMNSREQAIEKISYFANYDPLTDLFNRRHFFDQFNLAIREAEESNTPLSLCVCDLDHFKEVNDTLGHQAGDNILTTFAEILRKNIRENDFVGRFGGDEFVICFPDATSDQAAEIVERIRTRFAEYNALKLSVTSTFGIAELSHAANTDDLLLEKADKALYKAKENGRNQVHWG